MVSTSADSETPAPVGGPQTTRPLKAEDLPVEFLKVTKNRSTFSFTTLDLIKLNSEAPFCSLTMSQYFFLAARADDALDEIYALSHW